MNLSCIVMRQENKFIRRIFFSNIIKLDFLILCRHNNISFIIHNSH